MKLLYNNEGFVVRPDQEKLINELGLTIQELISVMEEGLGAQNLSLSIFEARQMIKWFERNGYTFETPESWITIFVKNLEEAGVILRTESQKHNTFKFRKIEWYDELTQFGKYEVEDRTKERFSFWFHVKHNG